MISPTYQNDKTNCVYDYSSTETVSTDAIIHKHYPTQKQIYQRKRALFKGSLGLILINCNDFLSDKTYSSWWERYKVRQIIHFAESLLRRYKCRK